MQKKFYILILCLTGLWNIGIAQIDKKDFEKTFKKGDDLYEYGDYKNALNDYLKIYPGDSLNKELNFKIGVCIYNLRKNRKQSLKYFERAVDDKNEIETYYYLGNLYHLNLRFDEAVKAFQSYKKYKGEKTYSNAEIDRLISITRNAKDMMKNSKHITIINMGETINSKYADYVPLISADESMMIFTSRRDNSTGGLLDPNGEYFEDVYISYKTGDTWTQPKSISSNINTNGHDACVALSADGEQLFVYRTDEVLTGGDIYISKFDGKDWTVPVKQSPDINAEGSVESSASLSVDAETLYVSSDRPGGFGGRDIYRIVRLPNGEWSKAFNLGSAINTSYDDDAPFIHPDGKTLYFSSKGHRNMGGFDVFKTIRSDEGVWSDPINLGSPINTVEDDIYFVLSVNGQTGYYSSNRENGYGSTDIYKIKMPAEDFDLTVISGFIYDGQSNDKPVAAKITLMDETSMEVHGIYKTNELTGKYILIVEPGRQYKLLIEAEGYHPFSQTVNSNDIKIITKLDKINPGTGSK